MKMINFTPDKLSALKSAYKEAVAGKKKSFIFEGDEWDTGYAKYAIEYLEGQIKKSTNLN